MTTDTPIQIKKVSSNTTLKKKLQQPKTFKQRALENELGKVLILQNKKKSKTAKFNIFSRRNMCNYCSYSFGCIYGTSFGKKMFDYIL
jgi:hypothetical protein